MAEQSRDALSDFTRYSRLSAWLGAAVLLVESVLGHSVGAITLAAVLLLGIGFVCFLVGMIVDARLPGASLLVPDLPPYESGLEPSTALSSPVRAPSPPKEPASVAGSSVETSDMLEKSPSRSKTVSSPVPAGDERVTPVRRPKFRERGKRVDRTGEPTNVQPPTAPVEPVESAASHVAESNLHVRTGVATVVEAETAGVCPKCESPIAVGQFVAYCPVCGATHHAACWVEHRFRCSVPGCAGHGSLDEPDA